MKKLILTALVLSGCAAGPDYHRPAVEVPASYQTGWKIAEPGDQIPRGAWWKIYQDPRLDQLMAMLEQQNPGIAEAEAQYRQTEALLRQSQSGLFPVLGGSVAASRSAAPTGISPQYTASLNASWEPDLWGAVRRSIEAGDARQGASAAQLAGIRLSSQAQLASIWLQLQVSNQQLKQLQDSASLLEETYQLTRNQYRAGTLSEAAVAQAESQWQTTRAQLTDKQLAHTLLDHALASAAGVPPGQLKISPDQTVPFLPEVPAGLPSALLERRPDIAAAERNMAAANAGIGVAQAAYFPNLSLSASAGYRSASFADWISLPQQIWSLGPQLALTLFDGGLRAAKTDQAIAVYDASVAHYRLTVLQAFQAVEDGLSSQQLLAEEARQQTTALAAARKSENITLNQYKAGTVSYLNVLIAHNSRINAESNLWLVKNKQYINSVALIAAIGGGW